MVRAEASWSLIGRETSVLCSLRTLIRSLADYETAVQTQSVYVQYKSTHRYPRGAPELRVEKKLCCQSLG